jgi:hypothetical protein
MFKEASRLKLRFESNKGNISVEDLWDLPLESGGGLSLDNLAKKVNKELKDSEEESFVSNKSHKNKLLELKLSILKDIIKIRLVEVDEKERSLINQTKRDNIKQILANKENEELHNKSPEELKKMLEDM